MTKKQKLSEAFKRAGLPDPGSYAIFTNSGVSYTETKFYGVGSNVPTANRKALEGALFELFGASAVGISYHIIVKVQRGPK